MKKPSSKPTNTRRNFPISVNLKALRVSGLEQHINRSKATTIAKISSFSETIHNDLRCHTEKEVCKSEFQEESSSVWYVIESWTECLKIID